jgi:RNA polymerase sigma factor (sigma-70 family)
MNVRFTVQVPKTAEIDQLIEKTIKKIERLLVVFQPELVHLHGRLTRHTAREGTICSLDVKLPTGMFAAEESAATAQAALRAAATDLVQQLRRHKERLRTDQTRGGKVSEHGMRAPARVRQTGNGAGREPILGYISANVDRLREFVNRQLQLRERMGELRTGQLDADEVLDEMIATALERSEAGAPIERERWFFMLAANAIRRLVAQSRGDGQLGEMVSVERDATDEEIRAAEQNFEFFEPEEETRVQDLTADSRVANPEEIAYTNEMVDLLDAALQRLPPQEREDLVLFTLEGFSVRELALLSERRPEDVRRSLAAASRSLEKQNDIPGDLRKMIVQRTGRGLTEVA